MVRAVVGAAVGSLHAIDQAAKKQHIPSALLSDIPEVRLRNTRDQSPRIHNLRKTTRNHNSNTSDGTGMFWNDGIACACT